MRIGCLQFDPHLGDVDNNLSRADSVLLKANVEALDILVLPELAFTGYNFPSMREIQPYLEPSGSGISALWARTTALKYNCHVLVGYPEKVDSSGGWNTSPEYYNSALVVNADGETVVNYRKTHLYYTDETWAHESPSGFYSGHISSLGKTSIGICMDINPYKFERPWDDFEFGFHVLHSQSNLVIISMAWLTWDDMTTFTSMPKEPDMETLAYWVTRLEPIVRAENDEEVIVVFCNRCGVEDNVVYAGTSAVIGIKEGVVSCYGILGRGEKELLIVDTNKPPFAKMVLSTQAQEEPIPTNVNFVPPTSPPLSKPTEAKQANITNNKPAPATTTTTTAAASSSSVTSPSFSTPSTTPISEVPMSPPVGAIRKDRRPSVPKLRIPEFESSWRKQGEPMKSAHTPSSRRHVPHYPPKSAPIAHSADSTFGFSEATWAPRHAKHASMAPAKTQVDSGVAMSPLSYGYYSRNGTMRPMSPGIFATPRSATTTSFQRPRVMNAPKTPKTPKTPRRGREALPDYSGSSNAQSENNKQRAKSVGGNDQRERTAETANRKWQGSISNNISSSRGDDHGGTKESFITPSQGSTNDVRNSDQKVLDQFLDALVLAQQQESNLSPLPPHAYRRRASDFDVSRPPTTG